MFQCPRRRRRPATPPLRAACAELAAPPPPAVPGRAAAVAAPRGEVPRAQHARCASRVAVRGAPPEEAPQAASAASAAAKWSRGGQAHNGSCAGRCETSLLRAGPARPQQPAGSCLSFSRPVHAWARTHRAGSLSAQQPARRTVWAY
ncbi:unnamed protein product [Prorocentrum cordatum]|uniref:Uncharacterized protein n=1 Tax=Prorocentrum cordatum TaxID=2364126 RepID=A0ABN9UXT2_9DINO|nr:unnamed protein product [Polarella glacialis]